MLLGLGWIAYLIATSLDALQGVWPVNWWPLIFASTFIAFGMVMNGVLFYLFLVVEKKQYVSLGIGRVLSLHFTGQLLRYLPGRFWGFVYQAGVTHGEVSKIRLARANIDFMLYSIMGSVIVGGVVVGVRLDFPAWITIAILLTGTGLIGALAFGGARLFLRSIARVLPSRIKNVCLEISEIDVSVGALLGATLVFLFSWVVYLFGWHLLSLAYPGYAQVDFIALGALYSLASIIGILAAVTPAGLGVREASFIFLSSGIAPPEVVAYFALFNRVWFLAIELLLCVSPYLILIKPSTK